MLFEPEEGGMNTKKSEGTNGTENKKKKGVSKKKDDKGKAPTVIKSSDPLWVRGIRLAIGLYGISQVMPIAEEFKEMCHQVAKQISHPTIITKGTNRQTGEVVVVDDYRTI